jgi:Trk K+ transport system NAD-binding subunit
MEAVLVPEGSPLAGQPLAQLNLIRRAGVQIGGIRHAKRQNLSPSGRDHFEAGDELLVLGSYEQIKEFRVLLSSGWPANA